MNDLSEDELVRTFLDEGGYGTVEDWARDSDYVFDELSGQWYTDEGYLVNIYGCIEGAMEASGFLDERG